MNKDDLKIYSVIVEGGSGCLFQPMTNDNTYILTAKHLLCDEIDDRGEKTYIEKEDGSNISILKFKKNIDKWELEPIPFDFKRNETYFPHNDADVAILKMKYQDGFNQISSFDINSVKSVDFYLSGFPKTLCENVDVEKHTLKNIKDFLATGNYCQFAQLDETLSQENISGFSGCGIMKAQSDQIELIGVQSKMISKNRPAGQIGFVPMKYFNQIIDYPENKGKLLPLLPPYLKSFKFLKDKAFDINASIYDSDISYTRFFLKGKAKEVIESNITPYYIKEYFKERLLLNEKNPTRLENEIIYITWLEFLTLVNIAKSKAHNSEDLEEIFNSCRLIYKDTDQDWLDSDFLRECLFCDYEGLKESGTVLIKTNKLPASAKIGHYRIIKGEIIPRVDSLKEDYIHGNLTSGVENIANAICDLRVFAFDKYNFIHFEYLKQFMLVEHCEDFREFTRLNEGDLLNKLKEEYGKIFRI